MQYETQSGAECAVRACVQALLFVMSLSGLFSSIGLPKIICKNYISTHVACILLCTLIKKHSKHLVDVRRAMLI